MFTLPSVHSNERLESDSAKGEQPPTKQSTLKNMEDCINCINHLRQEHRRAQAGRCFQLLMHEPDVNKCLSRARLQDSAAALHVTGAANTGRQLLMWANMRPGGKYLFLLGDNIVPLLTSYKVKLIKLLLD